MTPVPAVSIVMPVFDDELTLAASIESALAQTLADIEIICVDDASTDGTAAVVESFAARDPRVRLIRQERNLSAFQARRVGILAAAAEYVLFLDGDDELVPNAAQRAVEVARESDAELVGFGVTVIDKNGHTGGSYERRLQPRHERLDGPAAVLEGLFPVGKPAQGQLWRFLFRTRVLRDAYAELPDDLALPRVNDLPLMFLVAALATRYVSIEEKLYRYHFGRGGSGQVVDSIERAEFYVSAIRSIESIRSAVETLAASHEEPQALTEAYESARLSIVGYVTSQLIDRSDSTVLDAALAHLHEVASAHDIIQGAAQFYPRVLTVLKFHTPWQPIGDRPVRSVLLATSTLRTGGVSAVLASQAHYLREAGYRVTVVARSKGSDPQAVPPGVEFVELESRELVDRMQEWAGICREHEIDVVIDHQVLYTRYWPEFALMARSEGAATVGWLHNFVGRPIYDGNDRLSLIEQCSNTLAQLITLSPLDVAYFKLRGVDHAAFVPNPPSPMLQASVTQHVTKVPPAGHIELVWWGRLEQRTKQVTELIEIGVQLRKLSVDFRLTVIGPDWDTLTAKKFNAEARRRRVGDQVVAIGPRRGDDLIAAIDAADAFVSTSIIEGYQLTIAEAQARGLPVFMYELPWLTLVQDNNGVVAVAQGDAAGLARQISEVLGDADRYRELSDASLTAAARALDYDFAALYTSVVEGSLPAEFSPAPTMEDAQQLLGLMVFFAERAPRRGREGTSQGTVDQSSLGVRVWQSAAPLGRATLARVPGLRPLAHRAKGWLRAR
ncbi:glycosyltransferase [Microbacterium gorillae]|uniref:glycosyltransferase n=1 Tax=Microbacterium gorillae TaxID=1231063 RepID=UPI003D99C22A